MIRGDDVKELLQDAQTTALALSGHADYQRLLSYVLTIPSRVH